MGRRIPHIAVVLTLSLAAALAAPVAAQIADDHYQPISWQSAGDSYSSGEGVFGNVGECAQSDRAYGPLTASTLAEEWTFDSITFTAYTGHVTEDFFIARGDKGSLWDWAVNHQAGPTRVDIVALSFGGNDIGFGGMLKDCLDVPILGGWDDFLQVGDIRTGCDLSEEDARQRIDALLDPPEACTGSRATGTAGYGCDFDLGTRRGSLIDAYYDIVSDRLTPHGRLYVVGYPRLVAPVSEWPGWVKVDCQEILRGDSEKLGRLADHLDTKLREAVDRANEALGEPRVVFVDRLNHFRENKAELCGTNDDWINGLAVNRGEGINLRPQSSFHINADGHAATAGRLVEQVKSTFSRQPTKPLLPSDLVLKPTGLGPLAIGMSSDDALATGLIGAFEERCFIEPVNVAPLLRPLDGSVFAFDGVVLSVSVRSEIKTAPGGVGPGDQVDQLATELRNAGFTVDVDYGIAEVFGEGFVYVAGQGGDAFGATFDPETGVVHRVDAPSLITCD